MPDTQPRRRRKEARPAEILDAAMEEFALNGFAGTRLTDVAARAGISHGTIYNYFESKETLFRALFRARLVDSLGPGAPDSTPPSPDLPTRDLLRYALKRAHSQLAGSQALALVRILLVEADRFPDLAQSCWEEIFGKASTLLGIALAQGVAKGELRPNPLLDHPTVLLSPVITAALFAPFNAGSAANADRQIDAFLDSLFDGIAAR